MDPANFFMTISRSRWRSYVKHKYLVLWDAIDNLWHHNCTWNNTNRHGNEGFLFQFSIFQYILHANVKMSKRSSKYTKKWEKVLIPFLFSSLSFISFIWNYYNTITRAYIQILWEIIISTCAEIGRFGGGKIKSTTFSVLSNLCNII